jgi:CRP/FNR family transcriptional regulator, cyclic AMP receptor protein
VPVPSESLTDIELFAFLEEEERVILAEMVDAESPAAGTLLFRAGEPGDAMYVVRSGAVELSVVDNVGQKIVLSVVTPGDVFGELSLLDGGARTATAVVVEDCELIVLDREDLTVLFRKQPEAALHLLAAMGKMTRQADELLRTRVSRNVNEEILEKLTIVEKAADWIAWFSGSMPFLAVNVLWFGTWILLNTTGVTHFDPYPFGLLTMIVSLEAIFLSIFVLVSQNRQAAKDRVRSDVEYEINVKAELEVAHLHEKVDRVREDFLDRFAKLERLLGGGRPPNPTPRAG